MIRDGSQPEVAKLMHMEEGNTVRTFDMRPNADYRDREPTDLGYSTGMWEEDVLVVTTINISWEWVELTGVPMSSNAVVIETFEPSEDGNRLDYRMTIENPNVFTESPVFSKSWLAVPGELSLIHI